MTERGPETIGVRELRDHLSQYLARVEEGAEFLVTRRGRVVARLSPIGAPSGDASDLERIK